MPGPKLGTATLGTAVDLSGLVAGLDHMQSQLDKFADKTNKNVGKKTSVLQGIGQGIGQGLVKGGVQAVQSGFELIQNAFFGGMDRLQDVAQIGEYAQTLGMSVEKTSQIFGLAKTVGSDGKSFFEAISTMNKLTEDAINGTPEASKAFSQMGLDPKAFQLLDDFDKVFKALESIQTSGGNRSLLIMKLFGEDEGKKAIGLLNRTNEELRELAQEFTVTSRQVAIAQVATEDINLAWARFGRIMDELSVIMAPVYTFIADMMGRGLKKLQSELSEFGEAGYGILRKLATAFGYVYDYLKFEWGGKKVIFGSLVEGIGTIIDALGHLLKMFDRVNRWFGGGDFLGKLGDEAFASANSVKEWGKGVRKAGQDQMATAFEVGLEPGSIIPTFRSNTAKEWNKFLDQWIPEKEARVQKRINALTPTQQPLGALMGGAAFGAGLPKEGPPGGGLLSFGIRRGFDWLSNYQKDNESTGGITGGLKNWLQRVFGEKAPYQATGAALRGSQDAASATARAQYAGLGSKTDKQLAEAKRANQLLQDISQSVQNFNFSVLPGF